MSLFQRIKTPFAEGAEEAALQPYARVYPIGDVLRDRREELGLDLAELGEALRIKPVYLAALEQGRAQDLPGATYAIGFIRAYAQYLGLDSERVLERYKAESGEIHVRPDLSLPVPLGARSLPGGAILLVALILALCGYGTWYYLATGERSRPERVAEVPAELRRIAQDTGSVVGLPAPAGPTNLPLSASNDAPPAATARLASGLVPPPDTVLAPGSAASPPPVPGVVASPAAAALPSASPAIAASAPPAAAAAPPAATKPASATASPGVAAAEPAPPGDAAKPGVGVEIRALADCWIQVRAADETIVFSRVLKAGETYRVPRPGLFLRTGNAGALAIAVDGRPAPPIGGIGTLRRNVELDPQTLLSGTAVRG